MGKAPRKQGWGKPPTQGPLGRLRQMLWQPRSHWFGTHGHAGILHLLASFLLPWWAKVTETAIRSITATFAMKEAAWFALARIMTSGTQRRHARHKGTALNVYRGFCNR